MPHFRTLDSPEPVRRYVELKALIRDLTAELKDLEPMIWDAVDTEGGTADAYGARLESRVSRTYSYSPAVQEAEAGVRKMKAAERSAGTATIERATGFVAVIFDQAASVDEDGTPAIDREALAVEASMPDADRYPGRTPF